MQPRTVAKGDNHKPSPSTSEMDTKKMSSALVDEGDVIEIILDEMPHTAKRLREEQNDDDIEIIDPSSQEVKRGRFG